MWVLVLTASLLIRSIVGNLEVEVERTSSRRLSRIELGERSNPEIQTKYVDGELSRVWENNMDTASQQNETNSPSIESKQEGIPNKRAQLNETPRTRMSQISKRTDILPKASWIFAVIRDKALQNDDWSKEKKNPTLNLWGGKRVTPFEAGIAIRRPIRMSFNSWGGKRGDEILEFDNDIRQKKNKDRHEPTDGHRFLHEGYGVKRVAEAGKLHGRAPFNSWGGKRSQSDFNQRNFVLAVDKQRNPIESAGESTEDQRGNSMEEKRVPQWKGDKNSIRFNSWGGKRNGLDYPALSTTHNEIGVDYGSQDDIDNND